MQQIALGVPVHIYLFPMAQTSSCRNSCQVRGLTESKAPYTSREFVDLLNRNYRAKLFGSVLTTTDDLILCSTSLAVSRNKKSQSHHHYGVCHLVEFLYSVSH